MSWGDVARIALVLLAINLIGAGFGAAWEWGALGVVLLVVMLISWLSRRSWDRRIEHLKEAAPEERERELAGLDSEERSAARLALDAVGSVDALVNPQEGETFTYPATPRSLRLVLIIASLFMIVLPTALLVLDQVADDQRVWAALVAIGFSVGLVSVFRSWVGEETKIRITASGLQEIRSTGRRTGILWSEVVWVRERRWLTALEVYAADGRRRIRIGYGLEGFSRLVELLTAYLHWADEQFRGPHDGVSGESAGIGA